MRLLVFITKQVESINPILADMLDKGIGGATVIDARGMLTALNDAETDPPPIFGSLRQFINPEAETAKILLMLVGEEQAREVQALMCR